ncbi:MAG: PilZ domain-containing protein [Deltaproteobacteria bacterium]|nr:PilZ domain-containing protein [Deltaproteobacteria bacterium]MBI4795725.1 PilZ domain-containing protein [Deltaproteobacteria bacterium]
MKQRVTRRAQRYSVRLEVKEINGQPVADTFLVDLSALGAKLESSLPLSPRNQVEFSFLLPVTDTITKVAGVVVWLKPVMSAPGRYQMGLQFFNPYWDIDQLGRSGKL